MICGGCRFLMINSTRARDVQSLSTIVHHLTTTTRTRTIITTTTTIGRRRSHNKFFSFFSSSSFHTSNNVNEIDKEENGGNGCSLLETTSFYERKSNSSCPTLNSYVKLLSPHKNHVYVLYLSESTSKLLHFNEGTITLESILKTPMGSTVPLYKKEKPNVPVVQAENEEEIDTEGITQEVQPVSRRLDVFLLLPATMDDIIQYGKRYGQVIYSKDAAHIVQRLNIGNGSRLLEAGTGSGHFTQILAWRVGPDGKIFTFEPIEDSYKIAKKNVERAGLMKNVEMYQENLSEETLKKYPELKDLDAVFLDMKDPIPLIDVVHSRIKPGSIIGIWLPTTNQVSAAIEALEANKKYTNVRVEELLERGYKANAGRLRPNDRIIGHTGYMVFANALHPDAVSLFQGENTLDGELVFDGFFRKQRKSGNIKKNKLEKGL
jgi:tRNA (adenine57-N1/adenine58-N1)-methyltransferase